MNPKKKVVEEVLEQIDEVEHFAPETAPRVLREYEQPKDEVKPVEVKAEPVEVLPAHKPGTLVAFAAFDYDGEHYEPGEEFIPRKSWTRDLSFDEFRSIERKNRPTSGIAFLVPGAVIDKKTGERSQRREVLPVKEA